ncbi:MAG: GC-type dockerin domain-anchored protein [Phycisphaerales bacterium JB039]
MQRRGGTSRNRLLAGAGILAIGGLAAATVPTTIRDFFGPGTQPLGLTDPIESVGRCESCHGGFDPLHEPVEPWAASMMGQSARDPVFWAAMAIAEQDAAFSGDLCLRCHTPGGWLAGRSEPTSGAGLITEDFEGLNCNMCHRLVDPFYKPGISPAVDQSIIAALTDPPTSEHSGHFVVDPLDVRRGPFDLGGFSRHEWLQATYYTTSNHCGTCHDVSNPAFERQPDGTYALGDLDTPHPTHDKYDQFPVERTYREWLASDFAKGPIDMGGRFGGDKALVSTCQDCHMPDSLGKAAKQGVTRADLPTHYFNGGNTWALNAIRNLFPDSETRLTDASVADSIARTRDLLAKASDMELSQDGSDLVVRIINQTGHKLPTGYPEGRRMWINVEFYDAGGAVIAERGHYDEATATLTTDDTKVYEAKIGVDAAVSAATGVPEGPSFHFAINNKWYKDNRIPPRGFTNDGFEAVQAAPVAYSYADEQYWDDTRYEIPAGAVRAEVELYYQSVSKEYVEFLRDENTTNDAGDVMYAQWLATGMSAPEEMDEQSIDLDVACRVDLNGDGLLDFFDFLVFQNYFAAGDLRADFTGDGVLDFFDFLSFQNEFAAGCP